MINLKSFFIAGMLVTPTFLQADQTVSGTDTSQKTPVSTSKTSTSKEKSVVSHHHKKKHHHGKSHDDTKKTSKTDTQPSR